MKNVDLAPPSKKRRSTSTAATSSTLTASVSKDRKSSGSPAQTSPVKATKSGARGAPRGRNAKAQAATSSSQVANQKSSSKQGTIEDWTNEDLAKLIENLGANLPKSDTVKYSTQVDRIDWNTVQFGEHTAEECKEKWAVIMTKLRRFRTLSELTIDAKEWVKQPWMTYNNSKGKPKPPGCPKKPLTPYFRYFLEKREKHSDDNPELSMTDLAKLLAKKFSGLPDKKKMKYKESYEKENEIYKVELEKFKKEHPEAFKDGEGKSRGQGKQNGPLKPQTSLQLFLADKMSKHLNEAGTNKKDIEEKYKNQWKNLSNSKKVRWIKKAMLDEERYVAEFAEYRLSHPDFKPEPKKSAITKAEKEIKDKFDGKPDRPPNSGYSLYSKIMLKELKDIPSKEKMGEISRRWKELSDKERQSYAKQATEAINRYQADYKQYVANLTEDERKKLEDEEIKKKKKAPGTKASSAAAQKAVAAAVAAVSAAANDNAETMPSKPKKPMSALFFYQQEKLAQYKSKNPDRSEQELTRLIAREYGELTEKKKDKYKKMAEEAKKTFEITTSTKESELRAKIQKSEPKRPPPSGYAVFTSEMMSKLTDIEAKFRMKEASSRWALLSNTEQEKYKRIATDQTKKYQKEIQKFLLTLTEDEQKVYQLMKQKKSTRRNTKTQAVAAAVIKQENTSDDEESSKADNKESSSSESGSESGSDSSSESDNSGSESDSDSKSEDSGSEKDDSDEDSDNAGKVQRTSGNSSSGESEGSNNFALVQ
uniref:HMG box domain-containing protein n=1 Tax=Strigamia maritima TaxID=126957 RepID=T1JB35_STRMM